MNFTLLFQISEESNGFHSFILEKIENRSSAEHDRALVPLCPHTMASSSQPHPIFMGFLLALH